jgi:hypothetical protein
MIVRFWWDWYTFAVGLMYDKPYKSVIFSLGFLQIVIGREY